MSTKVTQLEFSFQKHCSWPLYLQMLEKRKREREKLIELECGVKVNKLGRPVHSISETLKIMARGAQSMGENAQQEAAPSTNSFPRRPLSLGPNLHFQSPKPVSLDCVFKQDFLYSHFFFFLIGRKL